MKNSVSVHGATSIVALAFITLTVLLTSMNCNSRRDREAKQAHLDSMYRDSTNKFNPYKLGQGTNLYNQQREALGDINKLTSQPQPAVPQRK